MDDAQTLTKLYDTVKQYPKEEFGRIIEEKAAYPYLYHLSPIRENLIGWLPITKEMKVLERNPECGAMTGKLLELAAEVTCVTDSDICTDIIRTRYRTAEGRLLTVPECSLEWRQTEGMYDMILVAGNFCSYIVELPDLKKLLKNDGKLIVADANRLGLKYMAGCQEEYRGGYFTGAEGYEAEPGIQEGFTDYGRSYTKNEYEALLKAAGYEKLTFYYPYPDYKFPSSIYSDDCLPKKGELSDNRRNFDRDRVWLFDERKVFDTLIAEGLFQEFSNSFLIEAG